jgi:hypothetical protein
LISGIGTVLRPRWQQNPQKTDFAGLIRGKWLIKLKYQMTEEQLHSASRDDLIQIIRTLLAEVASLKEQVRKSQRQASFHGDGQNA